MMFNPTDQSRITDQKRFSTPYNGGNSQFLNTPGRSVDPNNPG